MTSSAREAIELWRTSPSPSPSPSSPAIAQPVADVVADDWFDDAVPVDAPAGTGSLSARVVVALAAGAVAGCLVLNLALTAGRLTFFFDLCFIVVCLLAAGAVRQSDLFVVGVLPPFLYAAAIAALTLGHPGAIPSSPGVDKVFLTGLAAHAAGLVFGYAVTLAVLGLRSVSSRP
jgi:hypothetical protein